MKVQIKDLRGGEPQTAAEATPRNQSRAWERGARDRCVPGGEEEGMDDPLARMGTPKARSETACGPRGPCRTRFSLLGEKRAPAPRIVSSASKDRVTAEKPQKCSRLVNKRESLEENALRGTPSYS
ncbi:uncharacterized protein LOC109118182 isoform X1 [Fukomys damarensis]|uniref:uncharacterized protein LOC109118182 isoform X1 n=1 Tax=Fukomys damarensis TaxID=885580 RepID=UPI0014554F81|nr:uncharacterized protein LOC109118182 isoform X1 [Fukomys damarensis]